MKNMSNKLTPTELQQLRATVWIGKKGITESTVEEIVSQIKDKKCIKIKWLRNTDVDPEAIAEMTGTCLVQARGRTLVLAKKGSSNCKK